LRRRFRSFNRGRVTRKQEREVQHQWRIGPSSSKVLEEAVGDRKRELQQLAAARKRAEKEVNRYPIWDSGRVSTSS